MPENISTAAAVAKMHVSHVEQAGPLGEDVANKIDAFYDHVEELPTDRLVVLATALNAQVRQNVVQSLDVEDPTPEGMFGALFQSNTILSALSFVNLVLLSRFVTNKDDLGEGEFDNDLRKAGALLDAMNASILAQHSGFDASDIDVEAVQAEYHRLVATGLSPNEAAHRVAKETAARVTGQAPKAQDSDVINPTGFYL